MGGTLFSGAPSWPSTGQGVVVVPAGWVVVVDVEVVVVDVDVVVDGRVVVVVEVVVDVDVVVVLVEVVDVSMLAVVPGNVVGTLLLLFHGWRMSSRITAMSRTSTTRTAMIGPVELDLGGSLLGTVAAVRLVHLVPSQ
jgi:hypothetical protein